MSTQKVSNSKQNSTVKRIVNAAKKIDTKKIKSSLKKVGKAAIKAGEYAKIKIEIGSLELKIKTLNEKIGAIIYKQKLSINNADIKKLVGEIDRINKQISIKKSALKTKSN